MNMDGEEIGTVYIDEKLSFRKNWFTPVELSKIPLCINGFITKKNIRDNIEYEWNGNKFEDITRPDKDWIKFWENKISKNPIIYSCLKDSNIKMGLFGNKFKELKSATEFGLFEEYVLDKDNVLVYTDRDMRQLKFFLEKQTSKKVKMTIYNNKTLHKNVFASFIIPVLKIGLNIIEFQLMLHLDRYSLKTSNINIRMIKKGPIPGIGMINVIDTYIDRDIDFDEYWPTPQQLSKIPDFISNFDFDFNYNNNERIEYEFNKTVYKEMILKDHDSNWINFWEKKMLNNPLLYKYMKDDNINVTAFDNAKLKYISKGTDFGLFD